MARVVPHSIPLDNEDSWWHEVSTVGSPNDGIHSGSITTGGRLPVIHSSWSHPCVHISPVWSNHWSPSEWEGSWSVATSGSSSQGDIAIVVDLYSTRECSRETTVWFFPLKFLPPSLYCIVVSLIPPSTTLPSFYFSLSHWVLWLIC